MSTARRSPTDWSRRLAEALVGAGRIPGDTAVAVLSEAAVEPAGPWPLSWPTAVSSSRPCRSPSSSRISGIPSIDISATRPMGEAFRLVPELLARELTAIGYKLEGERITLACAEPIDVGQQREISSFLEIEVAGCVLADPVAIEHLMNAVYPRLSSEGELATAAPPPASAEVGAGANVSSSMMSAPAQVPEPAMAGAPLPHDVSMNGSLEPTYDAGRLAGRLRRRHQADDAAGGLGRHAGHRAFTPTLNPDGTLGHRRAADLRGAQRRV